MKAGTIVRVAKVKRVVTGVVPVDRNDEGFASIHLDIKMNAIDTHFKKLINDYEIRAVQQMQPQPGLPLIEHP